MYPKNVELRLR